jgi:deoxyribodipyrimidine photolyase
MQTSSFRNVVLAVVVASMAACASGPAPISNQDPTADFNAYRSFGFVSNMATNEPTYETLVTSYLKVAISQEFDKRGIAYAENPDLLVNFYINTQERIRSRSVPTGRAYYGWRDPFYDTWGGYGGYETQIDQFTEGTLHIDIVDAASNKLVWEGRLTGRVTDAVIAKLEKNIDSAVRIIMASYPVSPGGR